MDGSDSGYICFFCNDTPTTEIYTLSLHDALPILPTHTRTSWPRFCPEGHRPSTRRGVAADRKSTRLNSSHVKISYAVFCLKKKIIAFRNNRILSGRTP